LKNFSLIILIFQLNNIHCLQNTRNVLLIINSLEYLDLFVTLFTLINL
jgi:hypothetical protein